MLTAERLRELLHYDPLTGVFTWLKRRGFKAVVGSVAGTEERGYIRIYLNGRNYRAHRLAVLYMTGEWPSHQVDHKYGIRHDNRWDELRRATNAENGQNQRRARSDNKCCLLGVYARGDKWRAQIRLGGKKRYLGLYKTPEQAHAAYLEAKARLHPFQTIVQAIDAETE